MILLIGGQQRPRTIVGISSRCERIHHANTCIFLPRSRRFRLLVASGAATCSMYSRTIPVKVLSRSAAIRRNLRTRLLSSVGVIFTHPQSGEQELPDNPDYGCLPIPQSWNLR